MTPTHRISSTGWGLVVGCAVTLVSAAAYLAGFWTRLDDFGLDFHFRHFGTLSPDPRLVLVAIDDGSIREIGDWPWPRRRYAQLVRALSELGAKAIVLDILFPEASAPRIDAAAAYPHYDVDSAVDILGDLSAARWIHDDDELKNAIADAGNVYLAMFAPLRPPGFDLEHILLDAVGLIHQQPKTTEQEFSVWLQGRGHTGLSNREIRHLYVQALVTTELSDDFGMPRDSGPDGELALRALVPSFTVAQERYWISRFIARRKAREFLELSPGGTWEEFFAAVLPDASIATFTAGRHELLLAYRHEKARLAIARRFPAVPAGIRDDIQNAVDATFPLDKFAEAAKGVGIVSFDREESQGVVRSLPLLANVAGTLTPQLGLLVALDTLGIPVSSLESAQSRVSASSGTAILQLPIASDGETLINWSAQGEDEPWRGVLHAVPADRVLAVPIALEAIKDNRRRLGIETAELVRLRHRDTPAEYQDYVRKVNRYIAIEDMRDRLDRNRSPKTMSQLDEDRASLYWEIHPVEKEAVQWLGRAYELWRNETPRDDVEVRERNQILALYEKLGNRRLEHELALANSRNWDLAEMGRATLREAIEGKICLVGYTASGVADIVTTPIDSSMPGVLAHANVLNMILQQQVPQRVPRSLTVLILLGTGVAVSWFAASKRLGMGLLALAFVVGLVVVVGVGAFRLRTVHTPSLITTAHALAVWACVTAYRQGTEERARRRFQQALAVYTSPAVAARIAARASSDDWMPRPARVACFFSDLYGFTELSERLGPERTRWLLNPYLEAMSGVLVSHRAIVNKFMGDGIFAFFNAPIWPCDNPARAACLCAVDSMRALEELNKQPGHGGGDAVPAEFSRLRMRIGVASGEAFVGDYGSATKLDYTCLGDTVNVAARLEAANKMLGTGMLVDAATRIAAGDDFAFRALGKLELPGRSHPVETFELLGLAAAMNGRDREYAALFGDLIRCYQACEWATFGRLVGECRRLRPTDVAIDRFQEAVSQYQGSGSQTAWRGTLIVTQK